MKIDLHIHSKTGSDGCFNVKEIFQEAKSRDVELLSITDHDSIAAQQQALLLAKKYDILYITGVELNVRLEIPNKKAVSLDFLGYNFDISNSGLKTKLLTLSNHRIQRAKEIFRKLNIALNKEGLKPLSNDDIKNIQKTVEGTFGRPHIAHYLIEKGIVRNKTEAFNKYLITCDIPKYPLSLHEASQLIRNAGGILVLSHPNDPNGTSLAPLTHDLTEQTKIIEQYILEFIDGIECWHSRHREDTATHYAAFSKRHGLISTGGSDCHQKPLILGTVRVPKSVAGHFM